MVEQQINFFSQQSVEQLERQKEFVKHLDNDLNLKSDDSGFFLDFIIFFGEIIAHKEHKTEISQICYYLDINEFMSNLEYPENVVEKAEQTNTAPSFFEIISSQCSSVKITDLTNLFDSLLLKSMKR